MKIKNKILICILTFCFVLGPVPSMAQETKTVELEFESKDANEKRDSQFDQRIHEDGNAYSLKSVEYSVLKTEPATRPKEVRKTFVAQNGTPQHVIEEDGTTYRLSQNQNVNTTYVTTYTDYVGNVSAGTIPQTKWYAVQTNSGNTRNVLCYLTGISLQTPIQKTNYIDIVFVSYDAEIFQWQGHKVSKNTDTPLLNYERELLASVGADLTTNKVLSSAWTGSPYKNREGILCRNAQAVVQSSTANNRAHYAANVNLNDEYEYVADVLVPAEGEYNYTILATATYELVESSETVKIIMMTVGILVLIILIIMILWVLAKRRKEQSAA